MGKGNGGTRKANPGSANVLSGGAFDGYADGAKINSWVQGSINSYPYESRLANELSPTFNVAGMTVDISRTDVDSNGMFNATVEVSDIYGRDTSTMLVSGEYHSQAQLITEIKSTLREHLKNSKIVRDNLEEDYYNTH